MIDRPKGEKRGGPPFTFIAPTPFFTEGGASYRILALARGLVHLGITPTLLTYPAGRDWPGLPTLRPRRSTRQMRIGFHPIRPIYDAELLQLVLGHRVTPGGRVHAFLHEGALLALVKQRLTGHPFVLDLQGSLVEEVGRTFPGITRGKALSMGRWAERQLERSAAKVVVSSPGLYDQILQRNVLPRERLYLLPDGVAVEDFRPAFRRDPERCAVWRKRYGLSKQDVVAIYVGGLSPEQGIDDIIERAPAMVREVPQLRFLLFGRPTQLNSEDQYRERIRAAGLEGRVQLPGPLPYEDLPQALEASDIGLTWKHGPREEANGKIPVYMAAGLPTVTLRLPASEHYFGMSGENGGVIAESTTDAAAAVVRLAADLGLRDRMGKTARSVAEQRLTLEIVAQNLLRIHEGAPVNGTEKT